MMSKPSNQHPHRCSEEALLLGENRSFLMEVRRALRVFWEYTRAFLQFRRIHNCVTVFGSARFALDHPYSKIAYTVGQQLAQRHFAVMTGAGPGLMEATNRGAKEAGGVSLGCNIWLPHEQHPNPYLDHYITFHYFTVRKVMLTKYSLAFIVMPGGLGTLDELFELMTLIQSKKISKRPLVLMGKAYWEKLLSFLEDTMLHEGTVVAEDINQLCITDDAAVAIDFIIGKLDGFSTDEK